MEQVVTRKKLIEVSLPLEAINIASAREKSIRHGHPSTLHLWWARRPLAAARAVLFAQLVDDPSSRPELFPTEEEQALERQRLFRIIEELVKWENTTNETVLEAARDEIRRSWRRTCEDNKDHPRAKDLFNPEKLPAFHDPFAGGGSIPLEAQRLGLEAHASDLNPVAVLINKAMIEIPPRFAGKSPVNPEAQKGKGSTNAVWKGAAGLAEDVRYYGNWMRNEAEKRIGHLYPKVEVTAEMVRERPDLKPYMGRKLTVIAWLWARTVKSPNPAFAHIDVPLASTFVLSSKNRREAYVEPVIEDGWYNFTVRAGALPDTARSGTKLARGANFQCVMSGSAIAGEYIRAEAQAGRMGTRLMAIVAEGDRERVYLPPIVGHEDILNAAKPTWKPDLRVPTPCHDVDRLPMYGMPTWGDAFTQRQLVALTTFSDLVSAARERVSQDAITLGMRDDGKRLRDGGYGATSYGDAISVYLGFLVDQVSNQSSTMCGWNNINQQMIVTFSRQAIAMVWDYAECNILSNSTGSLSSLLERQVKGVSSLGLGVPQCTASQSDATLQQISVAKIVSTDPPYYDNIGYADLSDFFYVWLRNSLRSVFPDLFATLAVPKEEELVASLHRHGTREKAEAFFLHGMEKALSNLSELTHPAFPNTVFYAFKQAESRSHSAATGTGWETFIDAVARSGFAITGTWPIKTEAVNKLKATSNSLASSIVMVCRPRSADAPTTTRREFIDVLRAELPEALRKMQAGNIAPVDLAQAAIGPGMAVFTRYARVLDASGAAVTVREALSLINDTLDEVLAEQEGAFDADTRWALAWFEQSGFDPGDFGVAETLSKAKNTSVAGMVEAGILRSGAGKVSLLRPDELSVDWNPDGDSRWTAWESVHHLVGILNQESEGAAAALLSKLGSDAETVRDLAYRLYRICDQKNRPQEALGYNALVRSWGEISELASRAVVETQATMFERE